MRCLSRGCLPGGSVHTPCGQTDTCENKLSATTDADGNKGLALRSGRSSEGTDIYVKNTFKTSGQMNTVEVGIMNNKQILNYQRCYYIR